MSDFYEGIQVNELNYDDEAKIKFGQRSYAGRAPKMATLGESQQTSFHVTSWWNRITFIPTEYF